jgi:hypothetical protein
MTIHFPRAAKRFINVFTEAGMLRCTVRGVRGSQLIVTRPDMCGQWIVEPVSPKYALIVDWSH